MTGTNHGMTGAVIAVAVRQPYLALPLAFLSHFACDALPHFGMESSQTFKKRFNLVLTADFLTALLTMAVIGSLYPGQALTIWGSMILAASPDLMWLYHYGYVERYLRRPVRLGVLGRLHTWLQWSQTLPGLAYEVIWFALMAALLIRWS